MKKIYKLCVVIALVFISITSNAQVDRLSMTLLPQMPFANYSNPGIRVNYNGLFGIGFTNVDLSLYNSSIMYDNIFNFNSSGEPVSIDGVKLVNSLKEQDNKLNMDLALDLLNVGFRVKKLFVNIDWRLRTDVGLNYSKDFLGFFVMGNAHYMGDNPADFAVSADATAYSEIALGLQYDITNKLTVGIRPKIIFGVANMGVYNEKTKIYTDSETYAMSADIDYMIKGTTMMTRDINRISDVMDLFDLGSMSIGEAIGFTKNLGFGVDLGAEYIFNQHFGVSAGVNDLGFITWKESKMKEKHTEGTVINEALITDFNGFKDFNYNSVVNTIVDRIWGNDSLVAGGEYKTALKTKVQLQGFYQLNNMLRATVIGESYIINNKFYPSVTVAYSGFFFKFLNLTANYTYSTYVGSTVGAGIGLHLGPANFYVATDNVLIATKAKGSIAQMVSSYNTANVRVGLVFTIGKYKDLKTRVPKEVVAPETIENTGN